MLYCKHVFVQSCLQRKTRPYRIGRVVKVFNSRCKKSWFWSIFCSMIIASYTLLQLQSKQHFCTMLLPFCLFAIKITRCTKSHGALHALVCFCEKQMLICYVFGFLILLNFVPLVSVQCLEKCFFLHISVHRSSQVTCFFFCKLQPSSLGPLQINCRDVFLRITTLKASKCTPFKPSDR